MVKLKQLNIFFLCLLVIQKICIARHIGHEIIDVTQHSPTPRAKRDLNSLTAGDFPKQMEFTLHMKDGDKKLVLSKYISPHDVVVTKHDDVLLFDPKKIQYAVYQDVSTHSSMIVECDRVSETCTLDGTFYHGLTKWTLSPHQDLKGKYNATESLEAFDNSQTSRVVPNNSSAKAKQDPEHLYLQLLEKVKKEGHTVREKRASIECNIIEIEVLTDSSVYEYFLEGEHGYELAGDSVILRHYLALFGELDLRYKCLIEFGICIRVVLVRLRINEDPSSDWTNTFLGNGNVDALQTLFNCGTQRDGETTADLIACTTRLNLEFESNPSFRAISFFGVICQSQFADFRTFISEDLGDDTDLVLASILLPILNVTLDSAELDPSCNSSFLFIGTQFDDAPHVNGTLTNPWQFSNCSRVQLQQWLDFLDSGDNCLKTSSITVEDYDSYLSQTPFAGEIFDLDFQCQNTYGLMSFATIGPGETSVFDFEEICYKGVYCDVGGDNTFRTRVYNGSPCGCKEICIKNECVREFNIPLGGACEGCCECSDHNAVCDCETKTCVCADGFADENGDMANGTCIPVQPPGGSCPTNETCEDVNSFCNASNICICREGWVLRDGVCVRFCENDTLPYVANGVYIPQDNVAGSIANLQCDMGYTPNSIDTCSICGDNGTFTTPPAICVRDCGCPPVISNGDYKLKVDGNTLFGSKAILECCDGYSINSTVEIICQDTPEGWSTPDENCTINDCGSSLPNVTNGGYVANHGTTVGSIGTLQCDYGYVPMSDDDCIACLFNGSWAEPKTDCIRDCGCPPLASNGDYLLTVEGNTLLGSKASLECCEGYSTNSTVEITCQETAQGWSFPTENCTINDCGSVLPYVTKGVYVANHGTTVGSIGTLQCDYGYVPVTDDDCIVCLFNGSWSDPKTECIRNCEEPPVASNGNYILEVAGNTLLGAKARLECCEGFSTPATIKITCEDNEQGWSTPSVNCTINDCGNSLPNVTNGGYVANHGTTVGSIGTLQCDYGYTPISDDICIVCALNGSWTEPKTDCIRDCGTPPVPFGGRFELNMPGNTRLGAMATLVCCDVCASTSTVTITCEDTEQGWSDPAENCTVNDCGNTFPSVTNGEYQVSGTLIGSFGQLVCDNGYTPNATDICIVCLPNGVWTDPGTGCIRDCRLPPVVQNGEFVLDVMDTTTLGATATLTCCEGFSTKAYVTITCEDTSQGWSTASENCTINDCGNTLPTVTNGGYVANHGTIVGSIGTLECENGYVSISPDDCIACLFNGSWADPKTGCIRDCGIPPVAQNGDFILNNGSNTRLGTTATLTCCEGFSTYTVVTITCEDNPQGWSNPLENCTINDCGTSLPNVTNGGYVANHGTTVGSIGTLQCDYGYVPISDDDCIVCLFNGSWSEPKTDCIRDCGFPPDPFAGRYALDTPGVTTLGATATLICCEVCSKSSEVTITCEDTEQGWSDPSENCTVNDCGDTVPTVTNGVYNPSGTIIGSFATLICDPGYVPNSTDVCIVCEPNGVWTDPGTGCIRDCRFPPVVDNGDFLLDMADITTLGATASLNCCKGFSTEAYVTITCEDNTQGWSTASENCTINDCGSILPYVTNGGYVANYGTTVGSIGNLECADGYVPASCDLSIVCLFNGNWSEPKTGCIRDCGSPPIPPNGVYILSTTEYTLLGATAILSCCDGYSTNSMVSITCEDNPKGWSDPSENCTINDCGTSLPTVTNGGYVASYGTTVGSTGTLQCDYGYVPISSDVCIVCLFNGSWSEPKTSCIRDCGSPPVAANGDFILNTPDHTTLGATATLICCESYSTNSIVNITCEDTKNGWSDPSENCTLNVCDDASLPSDENGHFVPQDSTIGALAILECDPGFTADQINTCSVCQLDGTWSPSNTTCVKDCGIPPVSTTESYVLNEGTLLGATAGVFCCEGLIALETTITCTEDGWSNLTTAVCRGCPPDWKRFWDSCYYIKKGSVTNKVARARCNSYDSMLYDSNLVQIDTIGEREFVRQMFNSFRPKPTLGFWIGLYQIGPKKGSELWLPSRRRVRPAVADWSSGQPSSNSQTCTAALRFRNYKWGDIECKNPFNGDSDLRRFYTLCEINLVVDRTYEMDEAMMDIQ